MNKFLITVLLLGSMMLPSAAEAGNFIVGYNQAWFGGNYQNSFTDGFNFSSQYKSMTDMQLNGGAIIRIWLFQNRQGLNLAMFAPQTSSIQPIMLTNLEKTLAMARARDVKVYVTLFDGNTMPSGSSEMRDYFYNLLNNKYGERDAFNTYALTPVLNLLNQNQDVIFGLDLMNEIQAPIKNSYWSAVRDGPRKWIQETRNFVKSISPWLKVTSSSGWGWGASDITGGLFTGLGLDFYDLHVYSDSGTIPSMSQVCATAQRDGLPILLGEFGQDSKYDDDNLQKNSTVSFLNNAKNSCFFGALAWRFDAQENYWRFQRMDGSLRPAAEVMKNFK